MPAEGVAVGLVVVDEQDEVLLHFGGPLVHQCSGNRSTDEAL
jgi:hypothetical protein